jgi:hypothetical protein
MLMIYVRRVNACVRFSALQFCYICCQLLPAGWVSFRLAGGLSGLQNMRRLQQWELASHIDSPTVQTLLLF